MRAWPLGASLVVLLLLPSGTRALDVTGTPDKLAFPSRAIQPHRYAKQRTGYAYAVFLEPDLWQHFGGPEAVKAALRDLVAASRHVRAAG